MASRAGFGSRALVWRPLVYMNWIDNHSRVDKGVTFGSCTISLFCGRFFATCIPWEELNTPLQWYSYVIKMSQERSGESPVGPAHITA